MVKETNPQPSYKEETSNLRKDIKRYKKIRNNAIREYTDTIK